MTDSSLYSKLDADRILRRAAEIEGADEDRRLTLQELRSIAGEAGFGARAVDRAIAEAQEAASVRNVRPPVRKQGLLKTRLSTFREIPTEISSEQIMQAVRLFQPYRDGPAHVELQEHEITWRDRRGLRFAVTSAGGITEIRVYVSKYLLRKGRWMGWVTSAADRLEMLISLVARRDGIGPGPDRG